MLAAAKEGVTLRLKLTPKSSKNALVKIEADVDGKTHLKATVTAVPEKGKANTALIKLLSKKLGLPKTSIRLIAGEQSRYKTAHISGEPDTLITALNAKFRVLGLAP
jgi:uncharacterized protein